MKIKGRLGLLAALMLGFGIQVNAQKIRTYTSNEEDSMKCLQSLSLYGEFYKQNNYRDALEGWRAAVNICPKSRVSLYINGVNMYESLYKEENDPKKKEALLDTMFMVYDMRIEHFGEEGYVLGRKGGDYLKYKKNDVESAYNMLKKSYELQGKESEAGAILYYYQSAYKMYAKKALPKEDLIALYPKLIEVVEHNIAQGNNVSSYKTVEDNLGKLFAPVADCPDLIDLFQPKFKANPNDAKLLATILKLMESKDCSDSEFYIEVARKNFELEPSGAAAYSIANWYGAKQDFSNAIKYYDLAVSNTDDNDLKVKALLKKATSNLISKNYQSVKYDAQKVLAIDPSSAEAYILIGDAYAYGSTTVGDNSCLKKAGYWAAIDKYTKAKSLNSELSDKINSKIASAKSQFPSKEDCFFYSINEGTELEVGGWINEKIVVKF